MVYIAVIIVIVILFNVFLYKGGKKEIIADGKLKKFVEEKSLLNQIWILDTKKKVKDVLKESFGNENEIKWVWVVSNILENSLGYLSGISISSSNCDPV